MKPEVLPVSVTALTLKVNSSSSFMPAMTVLVP